MVEPQDEQITLEEFLAEQNRKIVILADAVNQLAMQLENLAYRSALDADGPIGRDTYRDLNENCHRLREFIAELIPD